MSQRDRLLDQIRRLALRGMGERQTDGQLLERFISERDESAFALLLRRHGAMVWSVCRRILGNAHDADDAFQAAFLVLVRKADSVRPREAVGNWLYGVAYRTALEARRRIARRRAKEQSLQDAPPPESKPEEPWHELWPILDRELSRLSDKYRLPIVLCDLEGRSRKEVARQLAIPEGTLSSRLNTGRKKLAARLARYGFTVTAAALGTLLMEKAAMASLSLSLLSATTKAALVIAAGPLAAAGIVSATVGALTKGVLKTMFIAKIKTATLVLCGVAALGAGTGGVYYQTRVGAAASPQADRIAQNTRNNASAAEDGEIDRLKRENQELRKMLRREGERKAAYREKLNTFVKNWTPAIKEAIEREAASQADPNGRGNRSQPEKREIDNYKRQLAKLDELTLRKSLVDLEGQEAELKRQFMLQLKQLELEREKLEQQMHTLEASLKKNLNKLDQQKAELRERLPAPPRLPPRKRNPAAKPPEAGPDKLDQILQRLERLEIRLDRLERERKP